MRRFSLVVLLALAIAVQPSSLMRDEVFSIRILQSNYAALVTGIADVTRTCTNADVVLWDIVDALTTYTTEDELGFTAEMYADALDNFFAMRCGREQETRRDRVPPFPHHLRYVCARAIIDSP